MASAPLKHSSEEPSFATEQAAFTQAPTRANSTVHDANVSIASQKDGEENGKEDSMDSREDEGEPGTRSGRAYGIENGVLTAIALSAGVVLVLFVAISIAYWRNRCARSSSRSAGCSTVDSKDGTSCTSCDDDVKTLQP